MVTNMVAQDTSVLILYDDTIPSQTQGEPNAHYKFAHEIVKNLPPHRISANILGYRDVEAAGFCQWLIIIYSPNITQTPSVGMLVSRVMQDTVIRQRRGVLLVTSERRQAIQLAEWNVIRRYDGTDPQIYNNILRTLQYTKIPYAEAMRAQATATPSKLGGQPSPLSIRKLILISIICFVIVVAGVSSVFAIPKVFFPQGQGVGLKTATPTKAATSTPVAKSTSTPQVTPVATIDATIKQASLNALTKITSKPSTFSGFDSKQWPGSNPSSNPGSNPVSNPLPCNLVNTNDYKVITTASGLYQPCLTNLVKPLKNFVYQISMTIDGDAGGVIFRADGKGDYYRFSVINGADPQQMNYSAFLCDTADSCTSTSVKQGKQLQDVRGTIILDSTKPITFAVLAQDSNIDLFVNGAYIARINDQNVQAGQIGVYTALLGPTTTTENSTIATFTDFKVWDLDK